MGKVTTGIIAAIITLIITTLITPPQPGTKTE